jgi:DNA repair protein NreA
VLKGKGHYLKMLCSRMRIRSVPIGREFEGSTPPSVFIGSYNYPKVLAGPMFAPMSGDTSILDAPERWIPEGVTIPDIVDFRVNLVRGKRQVEVTDTGSRLVEKLRDISLSKGPMDGEVRFQSEPKGRSFGGEHLPYGPSAELEGFDVAEGGWDRDLQRAYYDSDLPAKDAVGELHERGTAFSAIQKAFSVGAFGLERGRRLVPTRWSITACDTILGGSLLQEVRHYEVLDHYRLYEFDSMGNHYAVILTPTAWQYEWMEAFIRVMGSEELLFSDHETNLGKRGYSSVGGCYYSCKFAVLEALRRMGVQAGAIVLREAYEGYVPLGVFNVRENVRAALRQEPSEHASLDGALGAAKARLRLPLTRFIRESTLLKDLLLGQQTKLAAF